MTMSKVHSVRLSITASALAIAAITSTAALAQTAATASAATDEFGLKEIVVTAQKREQASIDVPISIAALGNEKLGDYQISELRDFVGQVPNLFVNNFNGRSDTVRLFIRGIGQNDVSLTQDPSVALYVDGIYVGTSVGAGFESDDIERVEVLRGPQGTLYGRNATGGAINLISTKPQFDGVHAKGQISYGNYNALRGTATQLGEVCECRLHARPIGKLRCINAKEPHHQPPLVDAAQHISEDDARSGF